MSGVSGSYAVKLGKTDFYFHNENCEQREGNDMTQKEIYCMGRADFLYECGGYSLKEGYAVAEKEWDENSVAAKETENKI